MAPREPDISNEAEDGITPVPASEEEQERARSDPGAGMPSGRLTAAEYDQLPEILNSLEVARILHVPRQQVSRLAAEGKLPGARIGRTWRFSKSAIERMVAGGWLPDEQHGE